MINVFKKKDSLKFIILLGLIIRLASYNLIDLPNFADQAAYEKAGYEFLNNFLIEKHIVMPLYSVIAYLNKAYLNIDYFNIGCSVISIYLIYLISLNIFKDLFIANSAALIMSFYPFNIFYSISGFSETFFVMLLLIAFYNLLSKKFILSYIFFVLSILTRPVGDLIFPFIILFFLIFIFKFDKKKVFINLTIYFITYIILMFPWWLHNHIKYDKFVRLNLATNFILYVGNNKNNKSGGGVIIDEDDVRRYPERFTETHSDYDFEIFKNRPGFESKVDYLDLNNRLYSAKIGYREGEVDPPLAKDLSKVRRKKGIENFLIRDLQFKKAAVSYIKDNPVNFFKNAYIKFKRFWSPIPFSHEFKNNSFFKFVSFLSFSTLLILSLGGLFFKKNLLNLKLIPLYFFVLYINLVHMVLISSIRYRFIIEWILVLTAAYSLSFILKKIAKIK